MSKRKVNLIDGLRVARHVRHLIIGSNSFHSSDPSSEALGLLASAVPHLKKLRALSCLNVFPEDPSIYSVINEECQNLDSLYFWFRNLFHQSDDGQPTTSYNSKRPLIPVQPFPFKNLKYLQIDSHELCQSCSSNSRFSPIAAPPFHESLPDTNIISMVRNSPGLVSLDLFLHTYGGHQEQWDLDKFCEGLQDTYNSSLRSFVLRESTPLRSPLSANSCSDTYSGRLLRSRAR